MFIQEIYKKLSKIKTPFYYYDVDLLKRTLESLSKESSKFGYHVHYALKANANSKILGLIKDFGFGADCVSGNEVVKAITCGFSPEKVYFAGVGKTDHEIMLGLNHRIGCFNCESLQEIEVVNELAQKHNQIATIALRINPNVDAHTHEFITTGLDENKFGIYQWDFENVLQIIQRSKNIDLVGIHFHIGSQITDLSVYQNLANKVNEIQAWFNKRKVFFKTINLGGGLGVNYHQPDVFALPDFAKFFGMVNEVLQVQSGQSVHFELGRALVAQCGTLITKVLYIKKGATKSFAIVDAGMSDLIRPALYGAFHKIENLSSNGQHYKYDVVGPICESSDAFGKEVQLPLTQRGDLVAIRTAGAYGQVLASQYNLRTLAKAFYSDEI